MATEQTAQLPSRKVHFAEWMGDRLKIISKDPANKTLVPLVPNQAQLRLFAIMEAQRVAGFPMRVIVLKSRRQGVSTGFNGYAFSQVQNNPNTKAFVCAHDGDSSDNLFFMNRIFEQNLPECERKPKQRSNKKEILWDHPHWSTFKVQTAGKLELGRSELVHFLHCSELAMWSNASTSLTAVFQCVPSLPDTAILIESTANGVGGEFHERWEAAVKRWNDTNGSLDGFVPLFLSWLEDPDNTKVVPKDYQWGEFTEEEGYLRAYHNARPDQLYWRRWKLHNDFNGDVDMLKQEYPSCVSGQTRVSTHLGLLKIEDAFAYRCLDIPVFYKGEQQTYRVTTKLGYSVVATDDHPIAMTDGELFPNQEFVRVKDIKIGKTTIKLSPPAVCETGEYQTISWNDMPCTTTRVTIDKDMARFLGYFMGDGCFYKNSIEVACCGDLDVRADVILLLTKLGGTVPSEREGGKKTGNAYAIRATSVRWRELLDRLGCLRRRESDGTRKRKVCVPEIIWQSDKSIIREFLRSLFESDGFNDYGHPRVMFFAKDDEFARDVQLLLLAFGITCRRNHVEKKAGDGHLYTGNELALRTSEAIRFNERIGFISARKTGRISTWKPKSNKGRTRQPIVMEDVVTSVEPCGVEPVYDMTVEPEHVFSANGILVHNCPEEAFLHSGRRAIPAVITRYHRSLVSEPRRCRLYWDSSASRGVRAEFGEFANNCWLVWHEPREGRDYVEGGDLGTGQLSSPSNRRSEPDSNAAVVIDRHELEIVAARIDQDYPDVFGEEMVKAAWWYNEAWASPEINEAGYAALAAFRRLGYNRTFQRQVFEDYLKVEDAERLGWKTGTGNRDQMIDDFIAGCRPNWQPYHGAGEADFEGKLRVYWDEFVRQEETFEIDKRGKRQHRDSCFDDALFAAFIAWQIHLRMPRTNDAGSPAFITVPHTAKDLCSPNAIDVGADVWGAPAGRILETV